jgi:integrase
MIQAKWSSSLQKWHIDLYSGNKRIKTFWSSKKGKQGKEEVLRKYEAYIGGADDDITVRGEFERFLDDYKARVLPETYEDVRRRVERYILPKIGARRLRTARITDFQSVINSATKTDGTPLSKKSLMNIRAVLVQFIKYARMDGCNVPSEGALYVPKTAQTVGKQIIPLDAVKALMDDSRVNTGMSFFLYYYRFLLLTGMRPGEALGLRYKDIDSKGFVTINQSVNARKRITTGKNKNARRRFKLPKEALKAVEDQKRFSEGLCSEYIFCGYNGKPAHQSCVYKSWKRLSEKIGAYGTSLYSFRHSFVSYYGASLPLPYLKTIIGHSVNMNSYHYFHDTDEQTTQAASILDDVNQSFTD